MKSDAVYLQHILEAIQQIALYTSEVSYEQFLQKRLVQDGVVRQLEIIGEASRNLSPEFRNSQSQIPWQQIIGLRNRVIHAYFEVNLTIIWEVVQNDLPTLREQLEPLI